MSKRIYRGSIRDVLNRRYGCLTVSKYLKTLGLVPWRSPSLGSAKTRRVEWLRRLPSGHGGCSVPMNNRTNAGGSIDGHFPIAWRVPYKRVHPRLKAGHAIDASIPMHEEGCMPQAAALRMSLRVPARNEWTEWISAPHDCDMCTLGKAMGKVDLDVSPGAEE